MTRSVPVLALWAAIACAPAAPSAEPAASSPSGILKKGARVAVVGDSITEQKLYSRYIEDYLTACLFDLDLHVIQLGWGGETAQGFATRMENDLVPLKPDVVTTCYGMNDGRYRAWEPSIGEPYENYMGNIVRRMKKAGAVILVGSPGAVDTTYFGARNPQGTQPPAYNDNLAHLRDIARKVAEAEGMPFANVHDPMIAAMAKAKEARGKEYDVCGKDGVHPGANGHLVMAYAFLKGLGLDGQIARIVLDAKAGTATASEGHEVIEASPRKVVVQSRRYPFCFPSADEKSSDSAASILPFVPFQEDLNRFTIEVRNLDAAKAKVTWGDQSKSFTREQLEKGVNLAAEFLQNPFTRQFQHVDEAVASKQNMETPMIKTVITSFRVAASILGDDAEGREAMDTLRARLIAKDEAKREEARAKVLPVRHTIEVTPE